MSAAPRLHGLADVAPAAPKPSAHKGELPTRTLVGALLALVAVVVTAAGGYVFAAFVVVAAAAAAREWHRMVGTARYARAWIATSAAIAVASFSGVLFPHAAWPLAVLAAGALFAGGMGATRGAPVLWSALGVLYIGVPAWLLVALRAYSPDAQWIVLGVFLVIWTADTGALAVGRLLGGPKLIPALSPNKTWAGLVGGLILPGLVGAAYVWACGGNAPRGFALGLVLAAAGHGGDLFESWVKRRVGRKDSGELIPGHGGVLDRIDSTLFVVPLAAVLVFLFGAAGLVGVHP